MQSPDHRNTHFAHGFDYTEVQSSSHGYCGNGSHPVSTPESIGLVTWWKAMSRTPGSPSSGSGHHISKLQAEGQSG